MVFLLVLEFELRKAKETIHDLREQITEMTAGKSFFFLFTVFIVKKKQKNFGVIYFSL